MMVPAPMKTTLKSSRPVTAEALETRLCENGVAEMSNRPHLSIGMSLEGSMDGRREVDMLPRGENCDRSMAEGLLDIVDIFD